MTPEEVLHRINLMHLAYGQPDALDPDRSFEDQGYDSTDVIEIILDCEKEFEIDLGIEDASYVHTPEDLATLVSKTLTL